MIAAMEAVGTKFSIKEYTSTGVHEKYLIFAKGGVDFLLFDGIVDSVFFHLYDSNRYTAYAHTEALVEGLAPGMPRAEVVDLLGPARQDREHFLLYAVGDAFVNIQLDDEDRISAIDAQRFDLLAQAEAEQVGAVPAAEPSSITGEISPYLDAVGTEDGSDAMLAAMEAVGTKFSIKEYTSTGVHEKYLIFAKGGVDFLLHDGIVETVFFHLRESERYAAYAHPEALVDGIRFGMSRDEVIDQLGTPRQDRKRYLLYPAGDAFVNIQIRDERVLRINAQRRDLAAETEAVPAAEPKPITGEISQLIDAAGSAYGDPVMLGLVELLGPRLDSHDIDAEDGGGKLLVFENGGVDLQYRDGALLAALIRVGEGERRPYPRLDALVDGLAFPATREDVHAALGEPRDSRSDLDLYEQQGTSVMFNYRGDLLATISIAQLPEE